MKMKFYARARVSLIILRYLFKNNGKLVALMTPGLFSRGNECYILLLLYNLIYRKRLFTEIFLYSIGNAKHILHYVLNSLFLIQSEALNEQSDVPSNNIMFCARKNSYKCIGFATWSPKRTKHIIMYCNISLYTVYTSNDYSDVLSSLV